MVSEHIEYIKKIFQKHSSVFDENKNKKIDPVLFYYYYVVDPENKFNHRFEFKLIGIVSVIETIMSENDYVELPNFIKKYPNEKGEVILKQYLKKYGLINKFKKYFLNYIEDEEDKLKILTSIKSHKKGSTTIEKQSNGQDMFSFYENEKKSLNKNKFFKKYGGYKTMQEMEKGLEDFASFLYDLRSEFVHSAKMSSFPTEDNGLVWIKVKKKSYMIKLRISDFLEIFEKSLVSFCNKNTQF